MYIETRFNVGDKVVVRTQDDDWLFDIGTIGSIEDVKVDDDGFVVYEVVANNDYWFYGGDDLELVPIEQDDR